jgi:diacylglycerol kinase family enzyme
MALSKTERVTPRDIVIFTQNFYLLKKANFNNIHALQTVIETTENYTFKQILQAIPRLFDGRLHELPFIHPVVTDNLLMHTKQHQSFEADGIVMDVTGPCQVTCMKHALQMIVPCQHS